MPKNLGGTIASIAVVLIAIPIGGFALWMHLQEQKELEQNAAFADGVITAFHYETRNGSTVPHSYTPEVVFWTASGQRVHIRDLSARFDDDSQLGAWVKVRYDAMDPNVGSVSGPGTGFTAGGTVVAFDGSADAVTPVVEFTA